MKDGWENYLLSKKQRKTLNRAKDNYKITTKD